MPLAQLSKKGVLQRLPWGQIFRWLGSQPLLAVTSVLLCTPAAWAVPERPATQQADVVAPMIVAVIVNGVEETLPITVLMDVATQQLWLAESDWRRLRLRFSNAEPRLFANARFIPFVTSTSAGFEFDAAKQSLALRLPVEAFEATTTAVTGRAQALKLTPSDTAAYLGYDVFAEGARAQRAMGGMFDLGISTRWGQLSATQFVVHRSDEITAANTQARRLDTTFTMDRPERLMSLRVGDFVASSGNGAIGSDPMRMGGIQLASNFAVRPGFVMQPVQSLSGQSTLPSVVEVFVNGVSSGRQNVPAGPFTIDSIPGVNGLGEVRLLVRDVLGREQVLVSSFYGSSQLLAPGLSDFSLSAGRLRYNYGVDSNDYRGLAATGYWRYGVTQQLTIAGSAEVSKHVANAGAGVTLLVPYVSVVSLAVVTSSTESDDGSVQGTSAGTRTTGHSLLAGFDRRMMSYSIGAQWRYASAGYRTVATAAAEREGIAASRSRRDLTAYASMATGKYGAFSLNYLSQIKESRVASVQGGPLDAYAMTQLNALAAGYSVAISRQGQLTLSATASVGHKNGQPRTRSYYLNYFHPLDALHSVGVSSSLAETVQPDTDGTNGTTGANRNRRSRPVSSLIAQRMLPVGEGYGYRIDASEPALFKAEGKLATQSATYGLLLSANRDTQGVRASVAGAIGAVDGGIYASRQIADSFVVVDAGNFSHVRVYLDNNLVGRTDANGRLMVPTVRSYQPHTFAIEPDDLPLSADIEETKLEVVPARRSGTLLRFPLKLSRGAQIRLLDANGIVMPVGAIVTLGTRQYPVAHDGEVYLLGLDAINDLVVQTGGKECRVRVHYAAGADALPHLGSHKCMPR